MFMNKLSNFIKFIRIFIIQQLEKKKKKKKKKKTFEYI